MVPLSDAEVQALILLFQTLEPPIQRGIEALINKIHKKQLTAQDYLDLAQQLISKGGA